MAIVDWYLLLTTSIINIIIIWELFDIWNYELAFGNKGNYIDLSFTLVAVLVIISI